MGRKWGGLQYAGHIKLSDEELLISQSIVSIRGLSENYCDGSWIVYGHSEYFEEVPIGCKCHTYTFQVLEDRYEWRCGGKAIHTLKKET